jgi:hypothetical protein
MAISEEEARGIGKEAADKVINSLTFETPEQLKEADTDYLKRHGVKRVGWRKVFKAEETEKDIEICGGDATRYYFDDKEPEELPINRACVTIPKEFFSQLKTAFHPPGKEELEELKEEDWVYAKVGTTEVRGRRDPTGIEIEQVSPTYDKSDFDKAVNIIVGAL